MNHLREDTDFVNFCPILKERSEFPLQYLYILVNGFDQRERFSDGLIFNLLCVLFSWDTEV